jgi:hypothetical protein
MKWLKEKMNIERPTSNGEWKNKGEQIYKPVIRYWLLGKGKSRSEATNVLDVQRSTSMFPAAVIELGSEATSLFYVQCSKFKCFFGVRCSGS